MFTDDGLTSSFSDFVTFPFAKVTYMPKTTVIILPFFRFLVILPSKNDSMRV